MRARRLTQLVVASVVGVLSVPGASPVWAAGEGYVDPNGDPTVVATDGGSGGGSGDSGGGGGEPDCWYEVIVHDDWATAMYDRFGTRQYSETGRWLTYVCNDPSAVAVGGWPALPEGGGVDPVELARQARESVPIAAPAAVTSPASGRLVVQMVTWLWIDGAWWHEYSATASAGRVSATITATPQRAVWSTGDGATVECAGAGTPWQPGAAADAATCSHTYRSVSPPSGFELSVSVEFDVVWSSNVGQTGTLDTISRTSTQVVHVGEIQAVGTR